MTDRSRLMAQLTELQSESGKRLVDSVITGMTRSLTRARYQLIRTTGGRSGFWGTYEYAPTGGWGSVLQHLTAVRRLMTLSPVQEDNFTRSVNTALLGGETYPILNFALGTAVGVASGGAGLIFGAATLALDLARTQGRVLARGGDELWQVENIGKRDGTIYHVGAYFLCDPFRESRSSVANGWLIHEERHELTL